MMRVSSFISSFRKSRLRYPAAILVFLLLLCGMNHLMTFLLVSDMSSYTRVMIHEMYTQEENIDILFLGSSHVYRSLDTQITDEIFGVNTFNAGTSSQRMDGSYALLVEAGKSNNIETVYLEMYYICMTDVYQERTELTGTYIISDYLRPSWNRLFYILNACGSDYWVNALIPGRRYIDKAFDEMYISNIISRKCTQSYRSYAYPSYDNEYYAGKGYVACTDTIENDGFSHEGSFDSIKDNMVSEDILNSLEQIIAYCQSHEIELVLYGAPMSDFRLVAVGNYDDYISQMETLCDAYGLKYYDFNLCKESYFSGSCTYYKDSDHLNKNGAEVFSSLFASFFTGSVSAEDLFYESYAQKLENMQAKTYGVTYEITQADGMRIFTFETIDTTGDDLYYVVSKKLEGSEEETVILRTANLNTVSVPADETGELVIRIYTDRTCGTLTNEIAVSYES